MRIWRHVRMDTRPGRTVIAVADGAFFLVAAVAAIAVIVVIRLGR